MLVAKPNSKTAPAPGTAQKGRQKRRAPQASPAGGTEAGTGQPASDMAMSALGGLDFQLPESRIQHRVSFSLSQCTIFAFPKSPLAPPWSNYSTTPGSWGHEESSWGRAEIGTRWRANGERPT